MQVCGRKALGLDNLLRLDTVVFEDVTQENRDVSGLVSQEVLVSLDVLATRGAWVASLAAIIATGLTTASVRFASRVANFAGGMVLDEGKSQVFVAIVKGVQAKSTVMVPHNPAFRQKAPGIRGGVWGFKAPRFFLFFFIFFL